MRSLGELVTVFMGERLETLHLEGRFLAAEAVAVDLVKSNLVADDSLGGVQ